MRARAELGENHLIAANEKLDPKQAEAAQIIGHFFGHILRCGFQRPHLKCALLAHLKIAINLLVAQHRTVNRLGIFLPYRQQRNLIIK